MKHKHADLIHAWADGAELQVRAYTSGLWVDDKTPWWDAKLEYRIKPEEKKPVVRWLWAMPTGAVSAGCMTEDQATQRGWPIKLEWSRTEFPE